MGPVANLLQCIYLFKEMLIAIVYLKLHMKVLPKVLKVHSLLQLQYHKVYMMQMAT